MNDEETVDIVQSPGGHWVIWSNGCKVDTDGLFRSAGDATEFANEQGWMINSVQTHIEPQPFKARPRDGFWYGKPEQ